MNSDAKTIRSVSSSIGLKEWAAVCLALRNGKQSLLLRKGGIHESGNQFQIDHPEFWFIPTRFHQSSEEIIPEEHDLLDTCCENKPKEGEIALSEYAVVEEIHYIRDEAKLSRLKGFHILSEETIENRFYYRTTGIFAVIVRVYQTENPLIIQDDPSYEGCKSFIEFPSSIHSDQMKPVLSEDEHADVVKRIRTSLFGHEA